ncbi:hypothetical protein [Nitrosospira lacus]|uniref:hypothetical protein n=1 Tax=Nitrosospira lacus TaxID=1288494 RepID=UPI0005943FEA
MAIGPIDFLQDIIGLGSPDKRPGGVVMHGDVFLDGSVEFRDAAEHATAQTAGDDIGGQFKKRKLRTLR